MRVDSVLGDQRAAIKQLLLALDNRLTAVENLAPEGALGQVLASNGPNTPPSYQSLDGLLTGGVSSVFGRIGDVVAQMGDYQFNQIGAKPTTIGGYGITDAYTKTEIDALLAALSLDDLDDVVITTPVVKNVLRHDGTSWVNAMLSFSDLTGTPTTLSGYGITDAYTKTEVDGLISGIDFPVDSVFGRTGAVVAAAGDYDAFYYTETEVDTLLAAKANSATTLAGYGITDAYTKTAADALLAAKAPLASPAFTGVPTGPTASVGTNTTQLATTAFVLANAGSGAVSSVFGRTGAVVAALGDYDASLINPGTFPDGDYGFGDGQIFKDTVSGQVFADPSLVTEDIHFLGHQTADHTQGLSWAWETVPNDAQAKVIVQMSGAYGSKMHFMTTNSFASGAKLGATLDQLGIFTLYRGGLVVGPQGGYPASGLAVTLGTLGGGRAELRAQNYTSSAFVDIRLVGSPVTFQTDGNTQIMNTSGNVVFKMFRDGTAGLTLQTLYLPGAYSFSVRDTGGTSRLLLDETNNRWQMNCGLSWSPDDTYDVGVSASAGRPRNIYVGTGITVGDSGLGFVDVAGQYNVNSTKVIGARRAGWGVPTGTATRSTFVTGSVTTAQLAERVKALIDDLTVHGLIGA